MYIKVTNGQAKTYTIGTLRKDNPNTSFPKNISESTLAEYDVYPCIVADKPSCNELTEIVKSNGFSQVNGVWTQTWQVLARNDEEKALALQTLTNEYERAVENYMNDTVATRGYSDIVSACSYAGAPNPFQAEGTAALKWRGDVWAKCYQVLGDFQAGNRTKPTLDELISELPVLVW